MHPRTNQAGSKQTGSKLSSWRLCQLCLFLLLCPEGPGAAQPSAGHDDVLDGLDMGMTSSTSACNARRQALAAEAMEAAPASNASPMPLLPKLPEDLPQLSLTPGVDNLLGAGACLGPHAHVQRSVLLETEAPVGLVHLPAAEAEE